MPSPPEASRTLDRQTLAANLETELGKGYSCPHCQIQRTAELSDPAKEDILDILESGRVHAKLLEHKKCGGGENTTSYVRFIVLDGDSVRIETYTVSSVLETHTQLLLGNTVLGRANRVLADRNVGLGEEVRRWEKRAERAGEILRRLLGVLQIDPATYEEAPDEEEALRRIETALMEKLGKLHRHEQQRQPVLDLLGELMDERDPQALLDRLRGHQRRRAEVAAAETRQAPQPPPPRWQTVLDDLRRRLAASIAPK